MCDAGADRCKVEIRWGKDGSVRAGARSESRREKALRMSPDVTG